MIAREKITKQNKKRVRRTRRRANLHQAAGDHHQRHERQDDQRELPVEVETDEQAADEGALRAQ